MKGTLLDEAPCRFLLPAPSSQSQAHSNANKYRRLGPRISESVKGRLRLGAKIIQSGGVKRMFSRAFSVGQGEVLIKASPCYLHTSDGPLAGLMFISTHKVAFCSDRPVKSKITDSTGERLRFYYKVVIPVGKIKNAAQSVSVTRPSDKYLQVVTRDEFEFWFMGLVSYQKTFECLKSAICQGCDDDECL